MITEDLRKQIIEAQQELRLAEQDENYAEPEFLDVAIEKVNLAKQRLNLLYKQAKL